MRTIMGGRRAAVAAAAFVVAFAAVAGAQSRVVAPKNKYSPEQDVELGAKAAAEVRQQMPLVQDQQVEAYVQRIGQRLVQAIPAQFQHPGFHYTFQVVNASDINAFALPGGPMFVNRGMIAAAHDEGEVAGVMAHELSHVALRHGTAQATKATPYEIGALAGAIIGSVVGGAAGSVISQGTQFGLGAAFLRFSREYEKQADILGSHIMAAAGYNPVDLANMFQTIEKQGGGSGGPQWLSDHPDPGNRSQYIVAEAKSLHVTNPVTNVAALQTVQADLRRMPPAQTTAQIMKNAEQNGATGATGQGGGAQGRAEGTSGRLSTNVEPPSSRFRTYADQSGQFRLSVPDNWRQVGGTDSELKFVPDGAYATANGQEVFTHGIQLGVSQARANSLREATQELIQALAQGNPRLQAQGGGQPVQFAGREGLQTRLTNISEATGSREEVLVTTALLDDGRLVYSVGVAPASEFPGYQSAFARVNESVVLR